MDNKNIIVTGASKGLGLGVCMLLLSKGANVFGVSRTLTTQTQELIKIYGGKYTPILFDLSRSSEIKTKVFSIFSDNKIPIHGLVNNAALSIEVLITDVHLEDLNQLISVNQIAPIVITQQTIKNMLLYQTEGSIVHITSISAHTGYSGLGLYGSTKGAIESFSKTCAREWGRKGIRSNCVAPGFMETDMTADMTDDDKAKIFKRNALKEAVSIESVAATIHFLLGEDSRSITGKTIITDAGSI